MDLYGRDLPLFLLFEKRETRKSEVGKEARKMRGKEAKREMFKR